MNIKPCHNILDTPAKKRLVFSIVIYFPVISLLVGAPLPLPSFFTPTPELMALLNLFSLLITLVGAVIGAAFYLERRSNLKFDAVNEQIEKIRDAVDEAVIATNEHIKIVRQDMKEMEKRLCDNNDRQNRILERSIEEKVVAAKSLEDERMNNINLRLARLEKNLNGHR